MIILNILKYQILGVYYQKQIPYINIFLITNKILESFLRMFDIFLSLDFWEFIGIAQLTKKPTLYLCNLTKLNLQKRIKCSYYLLQSIVNIVLNDVTLKF